MELKNMGIKEQEVVLSTGKVIKVKQLTLLAKLKLWGKSGINNSDVFMECITPEDKSYLDTIATDNLNDIKLIVDAINEVNKKVDTTDVKN
jgi:hypothetical protein